MSRAGYAIAVGATWMLACAALTGCSGPEEAACVETHPTAPTLVGNGTFKAPLTVGSPVSSDEWTVVVNSVTLCVDEPVAAQSEYNPIPDTGEEYILVNYTVTYLGPRNFESPWIEVRYVPASGEMIQHHTANQAPLPNFNLPENLSRGESRTGNEALLVPSPVDGMLTVQPGRYADEAFVAFQVPAGK
jgi:hypothetical protein